MIEISLDTSSSRLMNPSTTRWFQSPQTSIVNLAAVFIWSFVSFFIAQHAIALQDDRSSPPASFRNVVRQVQAKMVKIVGGGGVRGWEPYQSGFCISEDGYVLTSWSYVLEAEVVSVTLDDGQKYDGKLVGYDPQLEIAVLKIDTNGLSHFKLDSAVPARPGSRVLAFSNLYGVATGNDPVSVQSGVVSAITKLASRRGAFSTAFTGDVYLVDAITNNPGATGGVVCDRKGRLVGMIGKEFVDAKLDTWLNFAIPIDALINSVSEIRNGSMVVQDRSQTRKPSEPMTLNLLGIVLVPDVVDRTPPFVDRVVPGSLADKVGLRLDDLIISIDGQLCSNIKALEQQLEYVDRDAKMKLSVRRGREFVEVTINPTATSSN
jgi:serine protease Do